VVFGRRFRGQGFQRNTFRADPLFDTGQPFTHKESYVATRPFPGLRQSEASHHVTGSNLYPAFSADDQVPRFFQSEFSAILMREL
jgi:hypothetical protein